MAKTATAFAPMPPETPTRHAMIEVPLLRSKAPGHAARAVRMDLTSEQSQNLRDLMDALIDEEAALKSGARVSDHHGAIRWMLEQLSKGR